MAYLLALDQGTTSSRAIVFDAAGHLRGRAQATFAQHFPASDRVEHDPQEILRTQFDCAREALANAGIGAREVAAIGIANQRETTVLWERASGRALAPARGQSATFAESLGHRSELTPCHGCSWAEFSRKWRWFPMQPVLGNRHACTD